MATNEDRLTEALRARAARDAETFRSQHPTETPNERWVENSYTAALPLAKSDAGSDVDIDGQPQLFAIYKREVERVLGIGGVRPSGEQDRKDDRHEVVQEPTPGEN
jgi:hypothetical protein